MVTYGSNEYSQLDFDGTGFDYSPLEGSYIEAWAGKNFSIARVGNENPNQDQDGLGTLSPGLYCKGDNSMGQCDFPDTLFSDVAGGRFHKMDLGFNHGIATVFSDTTGVNTLAYYQFGTDLYLWGDNSYGQSSFPEIPDTSLIFMVSAGGNHNVILIGDSLRMIDNNFDYYYNDDGAYLVPANTSLIAWGDNSQGQCDIPDRFNPIPDNIRILDIDAGENHTIVAYDSSGTIKIAAWGDNSMGQLEVPGVNVLNSETKLLEIHSGYNHNVAILYDENVNYEDILFETEILDTLFVRLGSPYQQVMQNVQKYHPVSFFFWGDNSFGQCDVPELTGLFEEFGIGGNHNTLASAKDWVIDFIPGGFYGPGWGYGETLGYPIPSSPRREITSWGKNDFGQLDFPEEYYIGFSMQYGSDGGAPILYPNSPPKITGGGDHTMVIGSHITRSPMIDYNNPFQFNGELDDSLYQTITLRNIGPDTLFIDSVFIVDNITDTSSHPFYIQSLPDDFILFGDSTSFEIYCVFDTSAEINESAQLHIYSEGWWKDSTQILISSYFAPRVEIADVEWFRGHHNETISNGVKIYNTGNVTAYLDSFRVPDYFISEPLGEYDYIEPGDSLTIFLSTTLPHFPIDTIAAASFYFSNFHSINRSKNLRSMRYLVEGDFITNTPFGRSGINSCENISPLNNPGANIIFYMENIAGSHLNVFHYDFGHLKSDEPANYASKIDSLNLHFSDNISFVTFLASDMDNFLQENGDPSWDECEPLYEEFSHHDNMIIIKNSFFENLFSDNVESVIINGTKVAYIDTFNLENLTASIQDEINACGYNCLPNNAIDIVADTIEIMIPQLATVVDSVEIQNITDYNLEFSLETRSGTSDAKSFALNGQWHRLSAPVDGFSSPITISLWFKPSETNWASGDIFTTFFAPSSDMGGDAPWQIIIDDNVPWLQIGWKDENTYALASPPLVWDHWHHAVFVHDLPNQSMKIFLDGEQEVDVNISSDLGFNNLLGVNLTDNGTYTGLLSQTAIWNNALTQAEVMAVHEMGPDADLTTESDVYSSASSLYAYWKMDGSMDDNSGNGFNGTSNGWGAGDWVVDIAQTGPAWMSLIANNNQSLTQFQSDRLLISSSSDSLNPGVYFGNIIVYPEHNEYVFEEAVIKLTVTEQLSSSIDNPVPQQFAVYQNYPNPFNPITKLVYDIPEETSVSVNIYNMMGKVVKTLVNQSENRGRKVIEWDATDNNGNKVSSGMYFYSIQTPEFSQTKKMLLLK